MASTVVRRNTAHFCAAARAVASRRAAASARCGNEEPLPHLLVGRAVAQVPSDRREEGFGVSCLLFVQEQFLSGRQRSCLETMRQRITPD